MIELYLKNKQVLFKWHIISKDIDDHVTSLERDRYSVDNNQRIFLAALCLESYKNSQKEKGLEKNTNFIKS